MKRWIAKGFLIFVVLWCFAGIEFAICQACNDNLASLLILPGGMAFVAMFIWSTYEVFGDPWDD